MKTTDRRPLAILLALLSSPIVFAPILEPVAHAQTAPSELDRANARKLFNEGLDLRKAGDQAGALAKFEAADAIFATPRGRLEVGRQRVLLGRLVEGWTALLSVANVPVAPTDEAKYAANRAEAASLAKQVEPRIPTLRFTIVGAPAGKVATVRVDGQVVPAAALVEPRMVNPGTHVVTATIEGHPEASEQIVVKEGEARSVTLTIPPATSDAVASAKQPATAPDPGGALAPAPTSLPSSPPSSAGPVDAPRGAGDGQRTFALVAGGVGLVAIGVGAWLGLSARSTARDADEWCDGSRCTDARGVALKGDAIRQADLSTIAFVGGAAILWLTAPDPKPSGVGSAGLVVGLGSLGLRGTF